MKTVLAVEPGYRDARAAVARVDSGGDVISCTFMDLAPGSGILENVRREANVAPDVVVIPGGAYLPCPPGSHLISEKMVNEALMVASWHPRNRLTVETFQYCSEIGIPGIAAEPMSSCYLQHPALISGTPWYKRAGFFYAMPQRCVWEKVRATKGLPGDVGGITVYLGEEVAVSSHQGGAILDSSDPVFGEGPFGLTSVGTLPATAFVSYLESLGDRDQFRQNLKEGSGVYAYSGVNDMAGLEAALDEGQDAAVRAVKAMAYQVAKEIGRQVASLSGNVGAIGLCGPAARLSLLTQGIRQRVSKWAPVEIVLDSTVEYLILEGSRLIAARDSLLRPLWER